MFSVPSVHAIGILDVRLVNLDRNDGNLLVAIENRRPKLIPIDHGLSLPDRLEVYTCDLVWMEWPQAREPFGAKELEYIRALDGARDAVSIERQVGVRRECLRLMEVTTMLLQKGAEHGLTLHQIGLIMYREDRCSEDESPVQPSVLEKMITRCVDSALAAVGEGHGTVSSTVESLDLDSIRACSPIRRQVSPGHSFPACPSPLPSPMISPAVCNFKADLHLPPLDDADDEFDLQCTEIGALSLWNRFSTNQNDTRTYQVTTCFFRMFKPWLKPVLHMMFDQFIARQLSSHGQRCAHVSCPPWARHRARHRTRRPRFDFGRAASPEGRGDHDGRSGDHQDESPDETVALRKVRGSAARHRQHLSVRPSALGASGASREGSGKDASSAIFARPNLDGSKWSHRLEQAFKRHFEVQLTDYFKKHFANASSKPAGDDGKAETKAESSLASAFGVRPSDVD
ncbi:unnamed protein product [Durusdinium trenchii]|uniref:PI3K/PI4K catalytic domain-containing protein n=1 Tax=Durusdinium trenchii TaxID=1381693 RepID=A0ABP0NRE2_9DINO